MDNREEGIVTADTLIIVPCFNEAGRLDVPAFSQFLQAHPEFQIIFVNDGSSDDTGRIIDQAAGLPGGRIQAVHLQENSGKAEAVRQGFLKGFELSPRFIGYFDADMAAPLDSFLALQEVLQDGKKEIVFGSRVAMLGRQIERRGIRHVFGRVFATVTSMILGLVVYDTQCGAKLFAVTDRLKRVFSFPFMARWIFDVEILARFLITERLDGLAAVRDICVEVPLQQWVDRRGTKLRFWDFFTSAADLFRIMMVLHCGRGLHPYIDRRRSRK